MPKEAKGEMKQQSWFEQVSCDEILISKNAYISASVSLGAICDSIHKSQQSPVKATSTTVRELPEHS